ARLRAALRWSADLLLPHERGVREPGTDRGARAADRRDRSHRRHNGASRALGAQGQRSGAGPARLLARAASPTLAPAHTRPMYRAVHADRAGRVSVSDYAAAAFDGAATVPFS